MGRLVMMDDFRNGCPVTAYDQADGGYAARLDAWLANPHAYFKAFGPEARAFQRRHRSERLRTMTLVAPAAELVPLRPVRLCVDAVEARVASWEEVFALVARRLIAAHPLAFAALQRDGRLGWLGCPAGGGTAPELLAANALRPSFADLAEVVARVQWLFLACGIRLNEVIVQADPYTDEQWRVRKAEIDRRRAEGKAFLESRRAAGQAAPADSGDAGIW